ncbi:MAG: transcriptional regulator, TetR family [Frankiales bacterium]|nr:transcriptional regulator, TetR family [Frankiales bacterium]
MSTAGAPAPGRARRCDAERNAGKVLRAALEVFAERGAAATVPEIAARAGVGKATVYRSYPTKADLVAAVAEHRLAWLRGRAVAALEGDDAWAGLAGLLADALGHAMTDRALGDALASTAAGSARGGADELDGLVGRLLQRGKDEGRVRQDVTPDDLRVLVSGVASVLVRTGDLGEARWRHAADLIANAVRA